MGGHRSTVGTVRRALCAAAAAAALGAAPATRELVRESFTLDHLSSDWEILLHDPERVWPTSGKLRIDPAPAADWHAPTGVHNLVRYRFPVSGSRLEARTRVEIRIEGPGHGAALVLYQDDQNWVELAFRGERQGQGLVRMFRLTRSVGGERATVSRLHGRGPSPGRETVVLVLARDGPRVEGRMGIPMGAPGVVRRGTVGTLDAPGIDGLQVMLKALRGPQASPGAAATARVAFDDVVVVGRSTDARLGDAPDSLRLAYATDFRDAADFRRDFSVLHPAPGSLALENGLELVARYGIPGDRWTPIRNLVILNRGLPPRAWDVEVEVDATLTSVHDDVGIVLYGERGNALYVGHWALPEPMGGGRRAYLRRLVGGEAETRFEPEGDSGAPVASTTLVFRVEQRDGRYTAWVDVGGRGWARVGEAALDLTEPRLGLFARSARDIGRAPGAGVRFARLWVLEVERGPSRR